MSQMNNYQIVSGEGAAVLILISCTQVRLDEVISQLVVTGKEETALPSVTRVPLWPPGKCSNLQKWLKTWVWSSFLPGLSVALM